MLIEGDDRPFDQHGVMLANPAGRPNVRAKDGQIFIDWLISPKKQETTDVYPIPTKSSSL